MKEYLFVYRMDYTVPPTGTEEEMAALTKRWMDWLGGLAAQNKVSDMGRRLAVETGKVVKGENVVTNGPFVEIKESIGGYSLIKADDYDEAIELAKGCPILTVGGNVEVREISPM